MWEKRKVKHLLMAVRHLDNNDINNNNNNNNNNLERPLMSDCSSVVTVPVPSDLASEAEFTLFSSNKISKVTLSDCPYVGDI